MYYNKKITCSLICVFLAVLLIALSAIAPVGAVESVKVNPESKIDSALKEKMETASPDEKIKVSVWVRDIDKQEVSDDLENNNLNEEFGQKVNQEIIRINRETTENLYEVNNKMILDTILENISVEDSSVKYLSSYAPNIELVLTKDEIIKLSKQPEVKAVYSVVDVLDEGCEEYNASTTSDGEVDIDACVSAVGAAFLRDELDLTGLGIKIGLIENSLPNVNFHTLRNSNIILDPNAVEGVNPSHANSVATMIVGQTLNSVTGVCQYVGVVPDATLYCTTPSNDAANTNAWKERTEWLVRQGVNIINISIAFDSQRYTADNDFTKWVDHIVYEHDITIVTAAGYTSNVSPFNFAYNTIPVGIVQMEIVDGEYIFSNETSSARATAGKYYPHVVAPGYINNVGGLVVDSGNSFSAPLVVGCIAQLMQEWYELLTKPTLVKTLIMAGADGMKSSDVVDSSGICMDRAYGAGVVNVIRSRQCMIDNNKLYSSSYQANSGANINLKLTVTNAEPVRLVLNWQRKSTVTHAYYGVSLYSISFLKLIITSPSGEEYISYNCSDTVQLLEFVPDESDLGDYTITISRYGPTGYYTDFALVSQGNGMIFEQ